MTDTPVSTSTSTGNEIVTLADEIKKYKPAELISFLQEKEDLEINDKIIKILEKEEINGRAFLKLTEEKLCAVGLGLGPATILVDFAKECREKKLRALSSYKTKKDLSEVLQKYGIYGNGIKAISQFPPSKYTFATQKYHMHTNHFVPFVKKHIHSKMTTRN
jgi:hypothetical protein